MNFDKLLIVKDRVPAEPVVVVVVVVFVQVLVLVVVVLGLNLFGTVSTNLSGNRPVDQLDCRTEDPSQYELDDGSAY